ncbi:MAG: hypothetical protein WA324_14305 [Bryobacteraceae bacterium]
MFKMFSTMTLFGLLTISAAYGGSSQTLKADIPFAFMVRNTTLAAGNYQLTYDTRSHLVSVHGLNRNLGSTFALAFPATGAADGPTKLVFHCYDKSCWLTQAWSGYSAREVGLELPPTERQRGVAFVTRVLSFTTPTK